MDEQMRRDVRTAVHRAQRLRLALRLVRNTQHPDVSIREIAQFEDHNVLGRTLPSVRRVSGSKELAFSRILLSRVGLSRRREWLGATGGQDIVEHELLHALGMAHSLHAEDLMAPDAASHSLSPETRAALMTVRHRWLGGCPL